MNTLILSLLLIIGSAQADVEVKTGECRSDNTVQWASAYHRDCEATVWVDGKPGPTFDLVDIYFADGQFNHSMVGGKVLYRGLVRQERAETYGIEPGIYVVWGDKMLYAYGGLTSFPLRFKKSDGSTQDLNHCFYGSVEEKPAFIYYHEADVTYIVVGDSVAGPIPRHDTSSLVRTLTCENDNLYSDSCASTTSVAGAIPGHLWHKAAWISTDL